MARSFSNLRRGYVDTSLGQVHYREAGSGPPVVLLHQSALSGTQYDPILPALGAHYRAIAPDTIGYGMSDRSTREIAPSEYAANVVEVMDALGVTGPFAVVGTSTGAYFGTQLAVQEPDRVSRLILNGPVLMHPDRAVRMLPKAPQPPAPRHDGGHLLEHWQARYRNVAPVGDIVGFQRLFVTNLLAAEYAQSAYSAVAQLDTLSQFAQVRCPVFILYGDRGRAAAPITEALPLIPHIPARPIPGGTLDGIEEMPDAYAEVILTFLTMPTDR